MIVRTAEIRFNCMKSLCNMQPIVLKISMYTVNCQVYRNTKSIICIMAVHCVEWRPKHARIRVGIWLSLASDFVIETNSINSFKNNLDKFWENQNVKFYWRSDLTGSGSSS